METRLTKVTVPASYTDPELESAFEQVTLDLTTKVEVDGKHDGKVNQPTTFRQYKVQTIGPISSTIQSVIELNRSRHQLYCDIGYIQTVRREAGEKITALQNEQKAQAHVLQKAQEEERRMRCPIESKWKARLYFIILAFFSLLEGVLTYTVLDRMFSSVLVNALLSALVTLIAAAGLHVGAKYIYAAPTSNRKMWRYTIVLGLGLVFSTLLGLGRANANNEVAAIESQIASDLPTTTTSAWPYVAISFMAFVVCLALEIRYTKSPEEKNKENAYEAKRKEVKCLEAEIRQIQTQMDAIGQELTTKSDWVLRRQVYARDFESRLVALAQKVIDTYESTNLNFRTDRLCPEFFGEEVDFGFTLYYQNIFNPQKQEV